jgi:DnaJ-class molecular chaperone
MMDLAPSLELLGIKDISSVTQVSLKKLYRSLMVKHHPDNSGGNEEISRNISTAYVIIKDAVSKLELFDKVSNEDKRYSIILTADKLEDIYNGGGVDIIIGDTVKEIHKADINRNDVVVVFDLNIGVNGKTTSINKASKLSVNGVYEISCEIEVCSLTAWENVKLTFGEKERFVDVKSQSIKFMWTISENIKLEITLNKVIR